MPRRTAAVVTALALILTTWAVPAQAADSKVDPVAQLMARMSLEDKVGQMFVSYVYGTSATAPSAADAASNQALYGVGTGAEVLAKYHLGGVIYFSWSDNLTSPAQVADLSNGLQAASTVPLQVSTDQEGGVVNRIGAPLAVSPGNMAIGATFNPVSAYDAARVSGTELRALGLNVVDAPVVDVNTNPRNSADGTRAFGDKTAQVALFGAAAVAGYHAAGIGVQAKHFPGLGSTTVNTDNGVAVTTETRQQIMDIDVPSFRAAIAAHAESVMAAHIVAPALDPSGLPASLSQPIVTGVLREQLHYDGVVITDALSAAALAGIPADQIILDAVNAGDDELLMPNDLPGAVRTVLDAVHAGTISEARVDASVRRILRMKQHLGLFDRAPVPAPVVGTPANVATMAGVARHSITSLRSAALPLTPGQHVLVTGWGASTTSTLTADLTARGLSATRLYTGSPSATVIAQAVAAAQAADVTVVTTGNAWSDPTQQTLVQALLATGKPIVVAAVNGPYDIAYFPAATTYLAAYDYQPVSLTALADVLAGVTKATGHLPVTIRSVDGSTVLFPLGSG